MKKRILIKIGGRAFEGESGFKELAGAITANPDFQVIIVHGGGAEISAALRAADRPTEFMTAFVSHRQKTFELLKVCCRKPLTVVLPIGSNKTG